MGTIFTLDADTKSVIQAALDDIITELSKPCLLVYPPKWSDCVNCIVPFDPIGQKSSSIWRTGGPVPFPNGQVCPMCDGRGKKAEEVTESINLVCQWTPEKFLKPAPQLNIRVPYSFVQTKGYLSDLPKVLQADHIIFQVSIEGIYKKRYKLAGEPGDASNIIQGRYFIALWERID